MLYNRPLHGTARTPAKFVTISPAPAMCVLQSHPHPRWICPVPPSPALYMSDPTGAALRFYVHIMSEWLSEMRSTRNCADCEVLFHVAYGFHSSFIPLWFPFHSLFATLVKASSWSCSFFSHLLPPAVKFKLPIPAGFALDSVAPGGTKYQGGYTLLCLTHYSMFLQCNYRV